MVRTGREPGSPLPLGHGPRRGGRASGRARPVGPPELLPASWPDRKPELHDLSTGPAARGLVDAPDLARRGLARGRLRARAGDWRLSRFVRRRGDVVEPGGVGTRALGGESFPPLRPVLAFVQLALAPLASLSWRQPPASCRPAARTCSSRSCWTRWPTSSRRGESPSSGRSTIFPSIATGWPTSSSRTSCCPC